ncbi:hypothetical protein [Mycobacterium parmense]|uniref:Uncharacterized protein n=1 Tax=Mycobacterium parmense TaxID=185642 RepID=A0A7I7YXA6_9MYCO|nr:hypothetical protein [Mycobacterium parmense]MCV7353508.1 hypothetical protein [Mycobacterium parmense]ORW50924.1 hypothetical protein AWC20_23940 [Mycobacterium parmense]BBZ46309.1 hypothetical protein MPRM_35900 [Mycobacterium parmense]
MKGQGHRIFVDELARFAAEHPNPRVTAIAERAAAPLRVAVGGRRGVGRSTVARALDRAAGASWIAVTGGPAPGADAVVDVVVHVVAEVAKPEDVAAIAAAGRPVVAVLNKADLAGDLSGRGGDGPMAVARARCAELSPLVQAPVTPMIGLLAVAALDELDGTLWDALRVLAADPAGATCVDDGFAGFLAADNALPVALRLRLLDTLDLFGIAVGIAAARQGRTMSQVRALLRRVSGVDDVLAGLAAAGAEARYQRVLEAVAELEALAVHDESITAFLSRDDTVIARMAAAVDLAEAAGLDAGPAESDRHDPAGHLPRAARWQRYSRASVSDLHRACGADIARGSLRLWSQACGSLPGDSW